MIICDICNRSFKTSETLRKHKNKFHSTTVNLKIQHPSNEISNEEIAARYLNRQKSKLDGDKYAKLERKIKGLKQFRPKPYDIKSSQDSNNELHEEHQSITNNSALSEDSNEAIESPLSSPTSPLTESEDNNSDVDNSDDYELRSRDEMSRKHINCITVDRFIHVRNLIRNNDFDTIAGDANLVHALQVIIKGVLKGFIPICSSQRMVLTPKLKSLMYRFSKYASSEMVLKHRVNLKSLFDILGKSVRFVVDAFNRFGL